MSSGPTRGPVQRPGEDRDFTELFQRVEDLERFPPGRWIYVGDYPTDPDTTPDSPPFENGWVNVGGTARRLRFRRNSDWSLDIEGTVIGGIGGSAGSVVTTLNALYRPSEDMEAPGVGGSWLLEATGELSFFEGGDAPPDPGCDACAEIAAHIADTEDAHMASAIGYLGSSDLPSDNVQDAIDLLLALVEAGGGGGGSGSKIYFNKPAANITRTGTTVGAFSTAWQLTGVVVAAGENVYLKINASVGDSSVGNDRLFALFRGATQIAAWNLSNPSSPSIPQGPMISTEWIDENPGAGTYTYEVRCAAFSAGTVTVYQTNPTTDVTGGSSIFTAEVYTP